MAQPRKRPERTYLTSERTRRGRTRNLVGVGAISMALLLRFRELPETIPIHFTLSNEPDLYGPSWSIFILIAVMCGITALLAWASTNPELGNYPVKVNAENAQELYELGEKMMVRVGLSVMLIYLGLASIYFNFPGLTVVAFGMIVLLVFMVLGVKRMLDVA